MSTAYETALAAVEARLTAPTDFMGSGYGTRRGHLTPITKEKAPGAHIVGGDDKPKKGNTCGGREGEFTVSIFTRADEGSKAADPYLIELYARMSEPFIDGIVVKPLEIHRETEIADGDAARTDCRFELCCDTAGEWSLELPT